MGGKLRRPPRQHQSVHQCILLLSASILGHTGGEIAKKLRWPPRVLCSMLHTQLYFTSCTVRPTHLCSLCKDVCVYKLYSYDPGVGIDVKIPEKLRWPPRVLCSLLYTTQCARMWVCVNCIAATQESGIWCDILCYAQPTCPHSTYILLKIAEVKTQLTFCFRRSTVHLFNIHLYMGQCIVYTSIHCFFVHSSAAYFYCR